MTNPPSSSQSSPIFPAVETNTVPQDLLLEILPRLPVKSLIRFQTVHTSWQSLFQNPNFISAQFLHSNLLSPRKVLVSAYLPESKEQAAFFLSGDTLEADMSGISNQVGKGMLLLGSCNGVFCVTDRERNKFLLWNPATRETMLLPPPLLPSTESEQLKYESEEIQPYCTVVGFGLDPVGRDLKVVRLLICEEDEYYRKADVYSLKSRSWREIQVDIEPLNEEYNNLMFEGNYTYCNGSYHWVSGAGTVLSFDMMREVFELSKLPIKGPMKFCKGFSGGLSAIAPESPSMEVWSMVGSNNWELVNKFEPYFDEYRFLMPLWRDDDEILYVMLDEDYHFVDSVVGELCLLNITKQQVSNFPNLGKTRVRQLLPYEASLVSIRNWTYWT